MLALLGIPRQNKSQKSMAEAQRQNAQRGWPRLQSQGCFVGLQQKQSKPKHNRKLIQIKEVSLALQVVVVDVEVLDWCLVCLQGRHSEITQEKHTKTESLVGLAPMVGCRARCGRGVPGLPPRKAFRNHKTKNSQRKD